MSQEFGPIQTIPPGLLGFLQLKSGGVNPRELTTLLQPVLELRDWLFLTGATTKGTQFGFIGTTYGMVGWGNFGTVPQGEAWWVDWVSVRMFPQNAGTLQDLCVAYHPNPQATGVTDWTILSPMLPRTVAGSSTLSVAGVATSIRSFFLPPGAVLGMFVALDTGAGNPVNTPYIATIRYTPLKL